MTTTKTCAFCGGATEFLIGADDQRTADDRVGKIPHPICDSALEHFDTHRKHLLMHDCQLDENHTRLFRLSLDVSNLKRTPRVAHLLLAGLRFVTRKIEERVSPRRVAHS